MPNHQKSAEENNHDSIGSVVNSSVLAGTIFDQTCAFAKKNTCSNAKHSVQEYLVTMKGKRAIGTILIANNGIAAVKEIRSVRRWAYEELGCERAIKFVVMATPEDISHNTEYIRMADHFEEVPGGTNNFNYANVDLIIDIAERCGADAVWAGWGHASENPRLADNLKAKGIVFIGPSGSAMRALGDKIASTIIAQSANVPVMPWSGSGIFAETDPETGYINVSDDLFAAACVQDPKKAMELAEKLVGYPLMIKASEGGGGRGIRKVNSSSDFERSFLQVSTEVPGSPIFLMRLAENARHLEVQIIADEYGQVISLFGRDCSVQRRHQKIIEEAPVTIAPPEIFEEMERCAIRLAKLVGYVNAGTVEFLYMPESKTFCFLELNPRLQVEHPTTEMVSGVNIPAAQLQVAMGIPLYKIGSIRQLYGLSSTSGTPIDFQFENPELSMAQKRPKPRGHVIACRITAENPDTGFTPAGGQIIELNFRSSNDVWGYFSVSSNGGLHEYADSQFGHVFAFGLDRHRSRRNMIMALKEISIRGDFRTTNEYLIGLLETVEFSENQISTSWLDGLIERNFKSDAPDTWLFVICGAAVKAFYFFEQQKCDFLKSLEKGHVPAVSSIKHTVNVKFILDNTKYSINVSLAASDGLLLKMNSSQIAVSTHLLCDGGVLVTFNQITCTVYLKEDPQGSRLLVDGRTAILEEESDPTRIISSNWGKIIRWTVNDNSHVLTNQLIAEIESMKYLLPIYASSDGKIKQLKQPGARIAPGELFGRLELDDPACVQQAEPWSRQFPEEYTKNSSNSPKMRKLHLIHRELQRGLSNAISGMDEIQSFDEMLKMYVDIHNERELPYMLFSEKLSSYNGRLPQCEADLRALITNTSIEFPSDEILNVLERAPDKEYVAPLVKIAKEFKNSAQTVILEGFISLIRQFYAVESLFDTGDRTKTKEKAILEKRTSTEAIQLYWTYYSHSRLGATIPTLFQVLNYIEGSPAFARLPNSNGLFSVLSDLANMVEISYSQVKIYARKLLLSLQPPTYSERYYSIRSILEDAIKSSQLNDLVDDVIEGPIMTDRYADALHSLTDTTFSVFDVLPVFFYEECEDSLIANMALEAYVRRAYCTYLVRGVGYYRNLPFNAVKWMFQMGSAEQAEKVRHSMCLSSNTRAFGFRVGIMAAISEISEFSASLVQIMSLFSVGSMNMELAPEENYLDSNVINIALLSSHEDEKCDDETLSARFREMISVFAVQLAKKCVRRVTVLIVKPGGEYPRFFTYRDSLEFDEDRIIRHLEPAHAFQLELDRLSNFTVVPVSTKNKSIYVYHAVGKQNPEDTRFFVRALVRAGRLASVMPLVDYLKAQADSVLNDILDSLELASASCPQTDCNHLFINFIPRFPVTAEQIFDSFSGFIIRHGIRLWKLRVTTAEIRVATSCSDDDTIDALTYRFIISNISGVLKVEAYEEIKDHRGRTLLSTIGGPPNGSMHLNPSNSCYPTKEKIQPKRLRAHEYGTTYVYDYIDLIRGAVDKQWHKDAEGRAPGDLPLVSHRELVLDPKTKKLLSLSREPGCNTCGMVAWEVEIRTPEAPSGRRLIVIANDITYQVGSFGPEEDELFLAASQYARALKIPRIFISANSGARIGIANEVVDLFRVAWKDPQDYGKGIDYLYLTENDYKSIKKSVNVERIIDQKTRTVRMKIVDVIGAKNGIGVECLQGSGKIAGETSQAYDEIFTLTIVACHSVGIGAYLVRLGQRSIQCEGQPIILTGKGALNKILGREVYTSNLQLGGIQVMHRNGISHMTAKDNLDAVYKAIQWLSFVPVRRDAPLPVYFNLNNDTIDRDVDFEPSQQYDPRHMIGGQIDPETGVWKSGLFDRDSFIECMSGWSASIVTGRARLGGIPVGVIAVETRIIESTIPADPADLETSERQIKDAPGVWGPESAFKTAQAIKDFHREQLPLIVLANWRGFSGGQRDMYQGVLKTGSWIVDGLRAYLDAPVLVYIVPHGELRGGTWVVLDQTIQPMTMELYADETARGGVMEPEGIVEIKFRQALKLATVDRLAAAEIEEVANIIENQGQSLEIREQRKKEAIARAIDEIALKFVELHDKPGRMLAKGVIRATLKWKGSRRFFYSRLSRLLAEREILKELSSVLSIGETLQTEASSLLMQAPTTSTIAAAEAVSIRKELKHEEDTSVEAISQSVSTKATLILKEWYKSDGGTGEYELQDNNVLSWIKNSQEKLNERISLLRNQKYTEQIAALIAKYPTAASEALRLILHK